MAACYVNDVSAVTAPHVPFPRSESPLRDLL